MVALQLWDVKTDIKIFFPKVEWRLGKERKAVWYCAPLFLCLWRRCAGSQPAFHTLRLKSSKDSFWEGLGARTRWVRPGWAFTEVCFTKTPHPTILPQRCRGGGSGWLEHSCNFHRSCCPPCSPLFSLRMVSNYYRWSKTAVPNLFGTRDQFCGGQFFHGERFQEDSSAFDLLYLCITFIIEK